MEQELKNKLLREDVIVVTDQSVIQGSLCRHQDIRLSDAFNAPAKQEAPFLSLVNARITRAETGKLLYTTSFVMVARSKIEFILPVSDIVSSHLAEPPSPPASLKGKWVNAEELLEGIAPLIQMAD